MKTHLRLLEAHLEEATRALGVVTQRDLLAMDRASFEAINKAQISIALAGCCIEVDDYAASDPQGSVPGAP